MDDTAVPRGTLAGINCAASSFLRFDPDTERVGRVQHIQRIFMGLLVKRCVHFQIAARCLLCCVTKVKDLQPVLLLDRHLNDLAAAKRKGLFRVVISTLRRNIRVIVARHERVEIIDRAAGANRFCIGQFFAVLVYDRQCDITGRLERDLFSLARLDRQCIGCRVVSGGNRDRDRRIAGDCHGRAAVRVQFVSVDCDGRPGDRGGRIDFQYLFGIKDLIGIFRLGAGEALCRRLRRTCGIGHAQTAKRRHAVELQRQIHALCITVRTSLAGSEHNRIARRAARERIVNAGRFGLSRNILISGCTAYVRVNSLDLRAGSAAAQFKIRIQAARKAVRHLHSRDMILQRIFVAVRVKVIRITA